MPDIKEVVEDENKITTVIGDDITFKGKLKFKSSLKIKGNFEGKIETDGHLIIGREANVSADIQAGQISNSGTVNGKLKSKNKTELFKKSITAGDIVSTEVNMEPGSVFNGTCIMPDKK